MFICHSLFRPMEQQDFLRADALRLGDSGNGAERTLVALDERFGLHPLMSGFDAARAAQIEADVQTIRAAVGDRFAPPPDTARRQRHQLRALHHRLVKWDFAKIREAVALAGLAGTMHLPEALHIHDVCGGKGIVALYAVHLRQQLELAASGTCWELNPEHEGSHEMIREQWFPGAPVDFQAASVEDTVLEKRDGRTADVLAKHACGGLTDKVFERAGKAEEAMRARTVAVMTCCHSLLTGHEDFWPKDLSMEDRLQVAKAADPHKSPPAYERDVLGVVSRRIIDTLRARRLNGRVEEGLPFNRECNRNHVIIQQLA